MLVLLHEVGVAAVPSNVRVLLPCCPPKLVPVIVTEVPTMPCSGESLVITGITKKELALLFVPFTVTTMSAKPVGKLLGTGTTILLSLQELGVVASPPKVTVLLACVAPKLVPFMVTGLPTGLTEPTLGERLVMLGAV